MRYSIFALLLTLAPLTSRAAELGIKFDQIQPGTQFYYETDVLGTKWMERYMGEKNGQHIVHAYFPKGGEYSMLYRVIYYDSEGRMVRMKKLSTDHDVRFIPFHCRRSGKKSCQHTRDVKKLSTGEQRVNQRRTFASSVRGKTVRWGRGRAENVTRLNDANIIVSEKITDPLQPSETKLVRVVVPAQK